MTTGTTRAARFSADRGRLCLIFSLLALIWTLILIVRVATEIVGWIDVAAWSAWLVVTTVWTFGRPGVAKWSRRERSIANDELAREHQRRAALVSVGVLIGGVALGSVDALGYLSLPVWWPVASLGAGIAASGLTFGWLQVRS